MTDAKAFPPYLAADALMLLQPVSPDSVEGLAEAYDEAVFNDEAALQTTGVDIDAYWRVEPDRRHVLLVLVGRVPRAFKLGVRYTVENEREREFFLSVAQYDGPVWLMIYRDKEEVVRAVKSLKEGDGFSMNLAIAVETDLYRRPLMRLTRGSARFTWHRASRPRCAACSVTVARLMIDLPGRTGASYHRRWSTRG